LQLIKYHFSFSEIFYIDATNEQTLQADLKAITPGSAEWSMDATWCWLASQGGKTWLLFFDNADDVQLNLGRFIPPFGNILVTTRNPQLCRHAGVGADSKVEGMDCKDSRALLLYLSRAEPSDENMKLAELIVVVCSIFHYYYYKCSKRLNQTIGSPSLCSGSLTSRLFYPELSNNP